MKRGDCVPTKNWIKEKTAKGRSLNGRLGAVLDACMFLFCIGLYWFDQIESGDEIDFVCDNIQLFCNKIHSRYIFGK